MTPQGPMGPDRTVPPGSAGSDPVAVLLRGINVGRHNKVPMADLRTALTDAGFVGVRTYVASGNVVLTRDDADPAAVAARVRALVAEAFDVDVPCLARTADDLGAVVRVDPLGHLPGVAGEPSRHAVVFLDAHPDPDLVAAVDPAAHLPDRFAVVGREVHLWYPHGTHASRLTNDFWERRLGLVGTARNWRTVLAVHGMLTRACSGLPAPTAQ